MTDIIPVKAGQLTITDYFEGLVIVVSDPRIPSNDPDKQSFGVELGSIRPTVFNWDTTTAITAIEGLKPNDYVILKNVPATGIIITDYYLKQNDMLLVLSITPQVTLLPIISGVRKTVLVTVPSADSPFNAIPDMDILVNVVDGPVEIVLPTVKALNCRINIFPYRGRYEVNNLTLSSLDKIHGMIDSITVDVDNVTLQAVWTGEEDGWLIFGK
jgi:hypothetical protein